MRVSGIEYCITHDGILTEGTDYHIGGLGCEYAATESDNPCVAVPLYYTAAVTNPQANAGDARP